MAIVFDTLTKPNSAEPLAYRTVKVRTPVPVSLEDERREVMLESEVTTTGEGIFLASLDPLPDGNYYLLVYPGNDVRTVIVPSVDPPEDAAHQVPGSNPPAYGYWTEEIREDNPAQPSPVVIGVRQLVAGSGITIDATDPRRPRIAAIVPTAAAVGADPAGAADAARVAAIAAAASDATAKAASAQSGAVTTAAADATTKAGSAQSAAIAAAHTDAVGQVASEASVRTAADAAIQTQLGTTATAITTETTRATTAEGTKITGKACSTDGTSSLPAPTGTGLEFVINSDGLDDIRFNGASL